MLGIDIPDSFIVNTGDAREEEILFATKRYDRFIDGDSRIINGLACPYRLHQEDFSQALGIPSQDKYEKGDMRYLPKLFDALRSNAANPIEDQLKLWDILVYDYLVGNTDNHIKNLSLLYSNDLRSIRLAPAYDIVSTAIYSGSNREMAIGIGGERNIDVIGRNYFANAASDAGLNPRIALKRFDMMADRFEKALSTAAENLSEEGYFNAKVIKEKILKHGGYGHL